MKNIVFLLEEPSAKAMLEGIFTRIACSNIHFYFIVFQGKQDMHKRLGKKLRGWLLPDTRFLILRDQDAADCIVVKQDLKKIVKDSGKEDASIIRIACRELESFYLGDLDAVEQGLCIDNLSSRQNAVKFRDPDRLSNPSNELKLLSKGKYQKLSGSRAISAHLKLDGQNRSSSFNVLFAGLMRLVS